MTQQVRPAQLKDLGAIEALYRQQAKEAERPPLKRQFASTRLWFLLNNTFAAILPITSAADHVYVMENGRHRMIQGFVQAENAALGPHVWQILNLCLSPDLDRFQDGTALLDHLFNEGLKRGVTKFIVRVPVGDPIADLFKARGFSAYATEHALLKESLDTRQSPVVPGWRPMRREDQLGPVWCSLRHYDEAGIRLLQKEGFEVIASQMLMVRELPLKVPALMRVRIKDKRLVPQYG